MTLPPPDHACWARLIENRAPLGTRQAALMFLLKKLQGSTEPLSERKRALQEFFVKYQRVLDAEIAQLNP